MNARTLLCCGYLLLFLFPASAVTNDPIRVFMPDGQVKSHLIRVFVDADITEADKPELMLLAGQFVVKNLPDWTQKPISFLELARFQHWTETIDGNNVSRTGTLLLFDLRPQKFPWFKACMRITPVLKWGSPQQTAIGARPVYVGNMRGAALWTAAIVGALAVMLWIFIRLDQDKGDPAGWKRLLTNTEGRLSLSKTQAAAWTLCIGAMVFCFGLTRLQPPHIPETLVALMGLSLATRAIVFAKEGKEKKLTRTPAWRDLIHSSKRGDVAITKAQMLFWTCLVILLFCVKSLLDGELWDVPWQLVALMGMSQASYMVPIVKTPGADSTSAERRHGREQTE